MCVTEPRTCVKQPALKTCERQCVCRLPRLEDKEGNCVRRNSRKCREEANGSDGETEPEETTARTTSTPLTTTSSTTTSRATSTELFDADTTDIVLDASSEIFVKE